MFDNNYVKTLVAIKLHQLQREDLKSLTYQNVIDYLFQKKWKEMLPENLNDIATDVLNITIDDIVSFMSYQAIVEGKKNNLGDYGDLY